MKTWTCIDGICKGCPWRKNVCKQKEPTFNTLLRKEGLLEEKLLEEKQMLRCGFHE